MHLSPEFGSTHKAIEDDGFSIAKKIEMLVSSDSPVGIAKSMGLGLIGFGDAFHDLRPDIILMLGDRFELLSASSAALVAAIPIAHIHGGEVTEGAFDDAIRHSITKMSHLHFTATEEYRCRVIQLGENPEYVFNCGAPGIESIRRREVMDRPSVEEALGIDLRSPSFMVTWHPPTLSPGQSCFQFENLLTALSSTDANLVFTHANADTEGRAINEMIRNFVDAHPARAVHHPSLGQQLYLSALRYVSGVVGNSSSGLIEAPSIPVGTVNIGDRQKGRTRAESVIDCDAHSEEITGAIKKILDPEFQSRLSKMNNPYGDGDVARKIVSILETVDLDGIVKKQFYDCLDKTINVPRSETGLD
jgi:GDP/UDP-N,N'-diacetylbacillosamine 2-epimerase (hydrolysing)